MYKQNFTVNKNRSPCIYFWCLVARFITKQIENFIYRNIRFQRQHFCCNLSQFLITLSVIFVFPVLKPSLSNTLNTNCKLNPFIIHIVYHLHNFRFVEPSIPYSTMKEHPANGKSLFLRQKPTARKGSFHAMGLRGENVLCFGLIDDLNFPLLPQDIGRQDADGQHHDDKDAD